MQVIISSRHTELADDLREYIEKKFQHLGRYDQRALRAEVSLLEEKNRCEVEAHVLVPRAEGIHASSEGPEFRAAIDRVVDRLARQLSKNHARRVDHQAPSLDDLSPVPEAES